MDGRRGRGRGDEGGQDWRQGRGDIAGKKEKRKREKRLRHD